MDWKIELVPLPVKDVDRAVEFYGKQLGWNVDHDQVVTDGLRFVRSASAPLPDPVRAALGDVPLVVSWGMTEGASQITATPLGTPARAGTVGVPVGCAVQVRDEDGAVLPAGTTGALWVRGTGIVRSYLHGRAAERFDQDGWLATGDVGSVAEDGWVSLRLVGQRIAHLASDFDPRTFGHAKLVDLVEKTGAFEVRRTGEHGVNIRVKPEPAAAPAAAPPAGRRPRRGCRSPGS